MTETDAPRSQRLADLLTALDRDPVELVEALRLARESVVVAGPEAIDLDLAELEFLRRRARDPRLGDELRDATSSARSLSIEARLRRALATRSMDPAALFDLAELRAEARLLGLEDIAARAAMARDQRILAFDTISERLRFVAGERWVELSTEEEDWTLRQKVTLLDDLAEVYSQLARRTGDRALRRLARRARNASVDRELQLRMERVLTPTGVTVLESVSLLALLGVFVLLAIQILHGDKPWIPYADLGISLFFIVEFTFKLALAKDRTSWFLRNAATDLLPALPAALFFVDVPGGEVAGSARILRFLRIVWIARYVRAMRPLVSVIRLFLFMIRGIDTVVRRFSRILNRDFVFFERVVLPLPQDLRVDETALAFRALRREHVLLAELPVAVSGPVLQSRAEALARRLETHGAGTGPDRRQHVFASTRDIPVEHAIEYLWRLQPSELGTYIPQRDIQALDRIVRILNSRPVCWLPMIRAVRSPREFDTPEERVVDFGRRVALLLERWRDRALHFADLHGIVTGPQVLDRVASALVKASQRPAVRLLLFGGLFAFVRMLLGADSSLGGFLARFVATPLVILGGACLVLLALGRWLKALAGEAADAFRLTSEVHFLNLTELVKFRHESEDLCFLAARVYRKEIEPWRAAGKIAAIIQVQRTGRETAAPLVIDLGLEARLQRTALLYLDFLDGAPLHESDVQTTEQLLANLSLQNVRTAWLGATRRDRKRLRSLSLVDGSLLRGPYLWFRFVTESIAVETAKLVTEWNRNCLTRERRRRASATDRVAFASWLRQRRALDAGRLDRTAPPASSEVFQTTEFHALDFLSIDPLRRRHLERRFGRGVVRLLRRDRECMIREIFGTRPLHELPRSRRTVNFLRFWEARLSRGRVLFAPLYFLRVALSGIRSAVARLVRIVREILAPESAARTRERGRAPFSVALRKIKRMKVPGLLEAMRLRSAVDPAYVGAPEGWSDGAAFDERSELERDMDFLQLRERDREQLRDLASGVRTRVEELHGLLKRGVIEIEPGDDDTRAQVELAATVLFVVDRDDTRTLVRAQEWFERTLPEMESRDTRLPLRFVRRGLGWMFRGFGRHPVDRWLEAHLPGRCVSRRGRGNFKRLWQAGDPAARRSIDAWRRLDPGVLPAAAARDRLLNRFAEHDEIVRDICALRAVQSLAVLDVRNYRELVFDLGEYAADGEDAQLARALP